jgi:hypothetical protein
MMFQCPSNIILVGSSYSGKSTFIADLILNSEKFFSEKFSKIIYCYDIYQPLFDKFKHLAEFHHGIYDDFDGLNGHTLLVIDDLFPPAKKQDLEYFRTLFTKISHHHNITTLLVAHNIFYKEIRTLSLNSHYIVVFRQIRDKSQVSRLAYQICPRQTDFFMHAYSLATDKPFSHFIIALRQETPDLLRFSSNIFDKFPIYYIPAGINIESPLEIVNHGSTADQQGSRIDGTLQQQDLFTEDSAEEADEESS